MARQDKDPKVKKPKDVGKRATANAPSTQKYIPFAEIRDDLVIMKDGTIRSVILVSSLNFSLKSEDEQKGIIQGYVGFLNSIDFTLQIVLQSRRLNIDKYLEKLDGLARQQDNELLRKQTKSYRSFVSKLVEDADIMDKKFFVVVPYSMYTDKKKSYFTRFQEVLSPASVVKLGQSRLERYKIELSRRMGLVTSGLEGIGLKTQVLDTQALIEVFYNIYNPVNKQQRRIEDIDQMRVDRTIE